jgi:hypothetical protein
MRDDQALLREERYLYLTTPGRRSGRAHRVLVWFAFHEDVFYFQAHRRDHGQGTDWYRNLVAAGRGDIEVRDLRFQVGTDRFPAGTDASALVNELFKAKYGAETVADIYEGTRRIPVRAPIR